MNRLKRVISGTSAAVLSLSSLLTMGFTGVAHAAGQTCTWTGAGDYKFSTAANWSNCGGGAPQTGDNLLFDQWVGTPNSGSSNAIDLTNDLTGVILGNVTATGVGTAGNYYRVDTLTVSDGSLLQNGAAIVLSFDTLTSSGGVTLNGPIVMTDLHATSVSVEGSSVIYASSVPSMTIKSGASLLGAVSEQGAFSYSGLTSLTIENGADLLICGTSGFASINADITFGGGAGDTPSIILEPCMGSVGGPALPSAGAEFKGKITLLANAIISASNKKVLMNNTLDANGHKLTVEAGTTSLVMGNGVMGDIVLSSNSVIAPGASPGCLSTGNIAWTEGSVYSFELGGATACNQYDQIKAFGSVDLGNGTLTTTMYNGYVPKVGDTFTIVDNDSTDLAVGTFSGLVEGATFEQNGVVFKITYKGGDGNDVVLTVQNQPTTPDTGFALLSANPLLTLGATAGAAVVLVAMARKTRPAHARVHARRRK